MNLRLWVWIIVSLLWGGNAANGFTRLASTPVLIQIGGDLQFTDSQAASISNATFSDKFTNSYVLSAGIGTQAWGPVYVGFRYTYWLGQQKYQVTGEDRTDRLNLQGIGPELGWQWGNPRIQYRAVVGISYPLVCHMDRLKNSSQTFTPAKIPLLYETRLQLNLKFSSAISWVLEGGYRKVNLGNLQSDTEDFLVAGSDLDFSGFFLGTGLGIHF